MEFSEECIFRTFVGWRTVYTIKYATDGWLSLLEFPLLDDRFSLEQTAVMHEKKKCTHFMLLRRHPKAVVSTQFAALPAPGRLCERAILFESSSFRGFGAIPKPNEVNCELVRLFYAANKRWRL